MALRTALAAVAALIATEPALTAPETSISALPSALLALVGNATCKKPSPSKSSVACSPEPSATLPRGALMSPELETVPPSRPTKPPGPVVIVPSLLTAAEAPPPVKFSLPLLKSRSEIASVEATNPAPVFTTPERVINTPLGLTTSTCPLALSSPEMVDGEAPVTRFSVAAPALG